MTRRGTGLSPATGAILLLLLGAGCPGTPAPPPGSRGADHELPSPGVRSSQPASPSAIRFIRRQEFAPEFRYHNGEDSDYFAILEALGGGVAAFDFDRDDLWDVCLPGGGDLLPTDTMRPHPGGLWRNRGGWRLDDVSPRLPAPRHYTHAAAAADFDGDGFPDLLATGYGGVQLLVNQGDGTFREAASGSGLDNPSWGTAAAWGDLNGDGHLDAYIGNYVNWSFQNNPICVARPEMKRDTCAPRSFTGLTDAVFLSQGDGSFLPVHKAWGFSPEGKALGVLLVDLDGDGHLDIYVANDGVPNFVYLNHGDRVEDVSVTSGADRNDQGLPDGSMGLEAGDFNGDLLPDLWVSNYEQESMALYRAHAGGFYQHVSQPMGVAGIGPIYVGWGMHLSDYDGDGDEDVVIATGHAIRHSQSAPRQQPPIVLENLAGQKFRNVAEDAGDYFRDGHLGRGLAGCDLDNDGRCDLVISDLLGAPAMIENASPAPANWIGVRLVGRRSSRDPIGARVILKTADRAQLRLQKAGTSYLSTSDQRLLFAVPDAASPTTLEVTWPSGAQQIVAAPELGRYHVLAEP